MRFLGILFVGIFLALLYLGIQADNKPPILSSPPSVEDAFNKKMLSQTLMEQIPYPASFSLLPASAGGGALLATKGGRMWFLHGGERRPIIGVPSLVAIGEAGLFSVFCVLRSDGGVDVFISYAKSIRDKTALVLARARLVDGRLEDLHDIYTAPSAPQHVRFGGGIGMLPDGTLLFAIGDRGIKNTSDDTLGKIVRITKDGRVPPNNPYIHLKQQNKQQEYVWSSGYRNPEGLFVDMMNGQVWVSDGIPGEQLHILKVERGQSSFDPWMTWYVDGHASALSVYRSRPTGVWEGNLLLALSEGGLWRFSAPDQGSPLLLDSERIQAVSTDLVGCLYVVKGGERGRLYRYAPSLEHRCLVE